MVEAKGSDQTETRKRDMKTVKWKDDNDKTITTVITGVTLEQAEAAIDAELQEAREAFGLELNRNNFIIEDETPVKTRTMTVIKEWTTEEELEVPAHLEGKELKDWLSQHAEGVANDSVDAQWTGTYITDENNEDVCDWQ